MWSKTLSEKELLRYNDDESSRRAFEVVSLVCACTKTGQMGRAESRGYCSSEKNTVATGV